MSSPTEPITPNHRHVGMISPPKWFSYCGAELEHLRPEEIRVMNTQIRLSRDFRYDLGEIRAAADDVLSAAQILSDSDVEIVAQIGTPFSMVHGWAGACDLEKRVCEDIGIPFEMMGLSLIRVCQEMGIDTVTACTVFFTDDWTQSYKHFLADAGIDALYAGSFSDLGVLPQVTMLESCNGHNICTKEMMIDTVIRCCEKAPQAEAVLLSGLPCPQLTILTELEAAAGRPVISYPAIYARVLKVLGIQPGQNFGQMFSG